MHLLYLDESGNPDDAADKHFILAGLSAFEKNTHFLSTKADGIQSKHFLGVLQLTSMLSISAPEKDSGEIRKRQPGTWSWGILGSLIAESYASVRLFG